MAFLHGTRARGEARAGRTPQVRRVLLGASLVLAPALVLLGELVTPSVDWNDTEDIVATAVAESTRWQAGMLFSVFGFMLMIPAAIAAVELVRGRKPALALATVGLVGAGVMAVVAAVATELTRAAARVADTSQIAAYIDETEELGGFMVMFPLFFAAPIGILLLAFGLWRTRATPLWVPAVLVAALVLTMADPGTVATVGWALMTASFAGIAWRYFAAERTEIDLSGNGHTVAPAVEAPKVGAPG